MHVAHSRSRLPQAQNVVSAAVLGLTALLTPTAITGGYLDSTARPVAALVSAPEITGQISAGTSGSSAGGALDDVASTHLPGMARPASVAAIPDPPAAMAPSAGAATVVSPQGLQPPGGQPALVPAPLQATTSPADEDEAAHLTAWPSVPTIGAADLELLKQAIAEYRRGKLAEGDVLAARLEDDAARAAAEWSAIRLRRQAVGFARLSRFLADYPEFPMAGWVRRRAEETLFVEPQPQTRVLAFFQDRPPEMAAGKVVLARILLEQGQKEKAYTLVRTAWRENRTSAAIRAAIQKDFSEAITTADIRHLAEKLIYQGEAAEGLRIAASGGTSALALAQVLAASVNESGGAMALIHKLEPGLQGEAPVVFARIQHFRRAGQIGSAIQSVLNAPREADKLGDPDEWWIERRMMVRKALDAGDPASAYRIAAEHAAQAPHHRVDAEVHAGWVALQYLGRADAAARHFALARRDAKTPHSIARAAYWQGRAADAAGNADAASFYGEAARHAHVYFGQLARSRLGLQEQSDDEIQSEMAALEQATRTVALRALRALLDAEARDLAQPLIADAASTAPLAEVLAVGDLAARFGLPRLTLLAGKSAMQRGLNAEDHAFPTFGIPPYEPSDETAEAAMVYSIARQESEFDPGAISHAGARGLMQLMPDTARRTASRAKIPYDVASLTANPALNARIGATHLGELLGEYNGSYILTFAAYNAGGRRVKEWITAYGDPRDPHIDKIDWIERIPITETRHYVQKVLENLQVYRRKLNTDATASIVADMTRGTRRNRADLAHSGAPPAP